jgi:hypothetical protein
VADAETGKLDVEKRQRTRPKSERLHVPVENVPPLISPEQAARVQAYMRARLHEPTRHYRATRADGMPSERNARQ